MTPFLFLSGFLGAGKTTFLREVVRELAARGISPQVVLNDFQNALVDASLFDATAELVRPVNGACVCCDGRDDLLDTLRDLPDSPDRVVLLESNGATETASLVTLLVAESALHGFALPLQVAVVDCARWQRRQGLNWLEREQVRTANFLVLTRQTEAGPERTEEVWTDVRRFNRGLVETTAAQVATHLATLRRLPREQQTPRRFDWTQSPFSLSSTRAHRHPVAAVELPMPDLTTREHIQDWLKRLPAEVLRVKGVVRLRESPGELTMFQLADREYPPFWHPLSPGGGLGPCAILIGPGLDAHALSASLNPTPASPAELSP